MALEPGKVAIEMTKRNKQWSQWLAVLSASLSSFTAGICFAWSSPSLAILQSDSSPFLINNDEASWIAAFLPIGCTVGPVAGSYFSRYIGPKNTTVISAFPYIAGFIMIMCADGPIWLYCSRFLSGFAVGFGQTSTPIYIAEISENHNRGALMSFYTFGMGIGSLFMCFVGPYCSIYNMAIINSLFPVLLLATMVLMPDSPYFLVRINKDNEAEKSLLWLRRQSDVKVIQEEMTVVKQITDENISFKQKLKLLFTAPNPKLLGIISILFIGQSFCGAIVVMFFQEQIYEKAQVPIPAEIAVMITLIISNISGFLSLIAVDRWGRRPLLIVSALGCAASTGALGTYIYFDQLQLLETVPFINWIPVISLNTLQIFFYFGLSPIPTTQLGELFCTNLKEIAFCIGFTLAALAGVIVVKLYQLMSDAYGIHVVFWELSGITLIALVYILWVVPETKGQNFLEIRNSITKKTPSDLSQGEGNTTVYNKTNISGGIV